MMNFSEALDGMRSGNKLAREAWPAGCYVEFVSKDSPEGSAIRDYLRVFNPEGLIDCDKGVHSAVWQPVDIDLLSDDWCMHVEAAEQDWKTMYLMLRDQMDALDAGLKVEIERNEVQALRISELIGCCDMEYGKKLQAERMVRTLEKQLSAVRSTEGEYQRSMAMERVGEIR